MRAVQPLTPGEFALHAESLFAVARGLTRLPLDRILATIETEQHTALLGQISPTLLREALAGAQVLTQLAPHSGAVVQRLRRQADDAARDAQPARTGGPV